MAVATCVECDEEIAISGRPRLGAKVICSQCGARLEIVNTSPVELDWAYEDEDDDSWGGDDDYDFDDDDSFEDDDFDDADFDDDDDDSQWQ
jgi:lysine biosynthesis protein LysW